MSLARQALDRLVASLSAAVSPTPVHIVAGPGAEPAPAGVAVTPLSLERVGRSRRQKALLDLELVVAVRVTGPDSLDQVERLMVAVEQGPNSASALPWPAAGQPSMAPSRPQERPAWPPLGFCVRVPVTVPLDEPAAPLVTVPPVVEVRQVHGIAGVVVDVHGRPISGATVTAGLSESIGAPWESISVSGPDGGFHILLPVGTATLAVTHQGQRRDLPIGAGELPARLRWAPKDG